MSFFPPTQSPSPPTSISTPSTTPTPTTQSNAPSTTLKGGVNKLTEPLNKTQQTWKEKQRINTLPSKVWYPKMEEAELWVE